MSCAAADAILCPPPIPSLPSLPAPPARGNRGLLGACRLQARDRFLSASGVIIPSHATLYLAGVAEQCPPAHPHFTPFPASTQRLQRFGMVKWGQVAKWTRAIPKMELALFSDESHVLRGIRCRRTVPADCCAPGVFVPVFGSRFNLPPRPGALIVIETVRQIPTPFRSAPSPSPVHRPPSEVPRCGRVPLQIQEGVAVG